jgi:transposase
VKALESFPRILVYKGNIDFRKRRRSLSAFVQAELREDPFSATLFLFVNRRRDCMRMLYWDRTGFAMWEKELEEARFPWPKRIERSGCVPLTARQLEWLLEGVDIWKLKPHEELSYSRVC